MHRKISADLVEWLKWSERTPLVIRGARQVGKTWLVREVAKQSELQLFELNFERTPSAKEFFSDNEPKRILLRLSAFFNKDIVPNKALLFLDEIQAAPEILAKLRWFAEDLPELAIIATGSLLDFVLSEHTFSMPVGRINYLYLEPMSFEEYLSAIGQEKLVEFLANYQLNEIIPSPLDEILKQHLREYLFVGGMPAAVKSWVKLRSFEQVNKIQQNIITTYQDDFSKYAKRMSPQRLIEVFEAVPRLLGKKFKYSAVNKDIQSLAVKNALELLCKARVCHKVYACSGNGIPLSASTKQKLFKVVALDTGLATAGMGLSLIDILQHHDQKLINEGGIAEQLVGQLLRSAVAKYIDPQLFYWLREQSGAEAEVDYLIQCGTKIIPVEVKSGSSGTLRSLHAFMKEKGFPAAVRINADQPNITNVQVKDHIGNTIQYRLLSIPIYLVEQIYRLVKQFD